MEPAWSTNRLLEQVLHIQEELKNYFLFKHEIYKVITDFPIRENVLFRNFSKQASRFFVFFKTEIFKTGKHVRYPVCTCRDSYSMDPMIIFSDSRDPNRVPKTP